MRIFVDGVIEGEEAHQIVAQLHRAYLARENVVLEINSQGGTVPHNLIILEWIERLKKEGIRVITHVPRDAIAASCAAFLFGAGTPGMRYIHPKARVMLHECSTSICTKNIKYHDLEWKATNLGDVNQRVEHIFDRQCGLRPGSIEKQFAKNGYKNLFFVGQEAVDLGIADVCTPHDVPGDRGTFDFDRYTEVHASPKYMRETDNGHRFGGGWPPGSSY